MNKSGDMVVDKGMLMDKLSHLGVDNKEFLSVKVVFEEGTRTGNPLLDGDDAEEEASDMEEEANDMEEEDNDENMEEASQEDSDEDDQIIVKDGEDSDQDQDDAADSDQDSQDSDDNTPNLPLPIMAMLDDFQACVDHAKQNYEGLSEDYQAAVELLDLLQTSRAPLCLHEKLFEWHRKCLEAKGSVTRKTLIDDLSKRHHLDRARPITVDITLPYSKSRVTLVIHDFLAQVQSLLSDPRWEDKDFLFHNNDPTCPPPDEFILIADVNAGTNYRETYKIKITDPDHQVLAGLIFYMDGATCGQYDSLHVEALKFTFAFFTAEARDKEHAWRTLGHVTNYLPESTAATDIIRESGHVDSGNYVVDSSDDDDDSVDAG
jgi:hypothetical protein